jgi:O-glycosyl hydrolase
VTAISRSTLVCASLLVACALLGQAQQVSVYVTSKGGDRLAAKPALQFSAATAQGTVFRINPAVRYQKIDGFGASLLEAGLICINSLNPPQQEKLLASLFDAKTGAGYSAMKTVQAGTDFMSAGPWYTYDDTPGDVELKHFSIARDLAPNGQITFIRRARKYGSFLLQAPMDYPPDWMLAEVQNRDKQDVNPKYYDAMARYQVRYLQEYAKQGVFIDYIDPFNEPLIYTKIPFASLGVSVRDHLSPPLAKSGLKTKIQFSDFNNRERLYEAVNTTMGDAGFRKYISSLAYHAYGFDNFDKLADVHRRYPDLPLWQTEVCTAYETGTPRSQPLPNYDYADGDFWGNQIFNDMEAHASAWIYWNMILDENGGPWAVSPVHGNPEDNGQQPIVVVDRKLKKVTYLPLYYYLAHFSKFVRPGAYRVETTGGAKQVRALTFQLADGGKVAELLNSRNEPADVTLESNGRSVRLTLPAMSITTCLWK